MELNRTQNTIRNISTGIVGKAVGLTMPFIVRTVLLHKMGAGYTGLGSLFASILQVLSVAELGFTSAIIFSLYKPVAQGDKKEICELLALYRRIFQIVGSVITIAGCLVLPFLPLLIKGEYPADINLYALYVIYLANSVISYFAFGYKNVILTAYQRQDMFSAIEMLVNILRSVSQIAVLVLFQNYYLYALMLPVFTLTSNLAVERITRKFFPELIPAGKVNNEKLKAISNQIKGVALGRFSLLARNAFDSIILSVLLGLTAVTMYSNYYYIFTSVAAILIVLLQSMSASIGNSIATETKEKNLADHLKFDFFFTWIVGWCTVCMVCLYQPFMKLWAGEDLVFPYHTMILFCVYFYINHLSQIRSLYSEAAGLWWDFRYVTILEMVANLILNVLLGMWLGVDGIIIATIITAFFSSVVALTCITYKNYFQTSSKWYYLSNLLYACVTIAACVASSFVCGLVPVEGIGGLAIRLVVCVILPNIMFLAVYGSIRTYRGYCADAVRMLLRR